MAFKCNQPPYKAWRVIKKWDHVKEVQNPHSKEKLLHYPIFTDDELQLDEYIKITNEGIFTKVNPGLCLSGIRIPMELVEEYTEERQFYI